MTRLDDRLEAIERRLDEVQGMLAHLIALVEATELPESDRETVEELAREILDETWAEPDPGQVQYDLARNWAEEGRREDLSEFDLAGRNLRGVDLKDARLTGANLSRADLTGARLGKADLSNADLSRAQLARADLARATLDGADLTYTQLAYTKLDGATLRHALLTRATLTGANLSGADLGGAQLNRANLARANLKEALVTVRQLASASSIDGAIMPDGRLFDGDHEPYKRTDSG